MKITKNEKTGNLVKLEIEAAVEEFKKSIEKTIEEAARTMKFPGFRKGKAPRQMIEKNLDMQAVESHAAQDLISGLYPQIIKEANLNPVDYPKVDIPKIDQTQPFIFSLEIEVYPEVKLGKYKGLKVEKKSAEVKEEDVEKVLNNLRGRLAKWKAVAERPVQKEDVVDLEIQAEAQGVEIKRWPRDLQFYPVGGNYISSDFDQQLIGLETGGEKGFKISFGEDYSIKEVAGKDISFKVKVKKISEKELPELNDELAKQFGAFETVEALKTELKKNLEEEKKQEAEADLKNKLLEQASKNAAIDIPAVMINNEIEIMLDELKDSLARSNLTLENYLKSISKTEESLREEMKGAASARVTSKIVLKAIAEKEDIKAEGAELDEEIKHMAMHENKDPEEFKSSLKESSIAFIKNYLLRRKALDFLVNEAKISTKGE